VGVAPSDIAAARDGQDDDWQASIIAATGAIRLPPSPSMPATHRSAHDSGALMPRMLRRTA